MARRRTGGKRRPLYVECQKCLKRFEFWTSGRANEKRLHKDWQLVEVPLKLVGKRLEWPHEGNTYKLSAWVHGGDCGGKLKRLDIPDPIRKVMPDQRKLECGHDYHIRRDMFGDVPGIKRACAECGKAARIQAVKSGKFQFWELNLKIEDIST